MSYTDLSNYIEEKLLYIAPSGIPLRFSKNQISLLGGDANENTLRQFSRDKSFEIVIFHLDAFCLKYIKPDLFPSDISQVLLLGDTHHGEFPLSNLISWLKASSIKRVVNYSCSHHDEIITKSTGIESIYFPAVFAIRKWIEPSLLIRNNMVTHIASLSRNHIRRKMLIKSLTLAGADMECISVFGDQMLNRLNKSLAIINCSLNCDISHRISEALACGTILLTDKLTPFQKFVRKLSEECVINVYDRENIYEVKEAISELSDRSRTKSGRESIYIQKKKSFESFTHIIKYNDIYKLAADFILLKDVKLPDFLIPMQTDLKSNEISENLSFYEKAMLSHQKDRAKDFISSNKLVIHRESIVGKLLIRLTDFSKIIT